MVFHGLRIVLGVGEHHSVGPDQGDPRLRAPLGIAGPRSRLGRIGGVELAGENAPFGGKLLLHRRRLPPHH